MSANASAVPRSRDSRATLAPAADGVSSLDFRRLGFVVDSHLSDDEKCVGC